MKVEELEKLWDKAIQDLLGNPISINKLNILAQQTFDSIRRIQIYKTYQIKAEQAVLEKKPFIYTSNPFVLAQRSDLSIQNRAWIIYLATYFGKSNKSKWTLFNRATFNTDQSLIEFNIIKEDLDNYFKHLSSFDFFKDSAYSNHRKYTAKKLTGNKGLFSSMEYFVNNIDLYSSEDELEFHEMYLLSQKIPNFGRLGGFDFSSSLVKCGFNIKEPKSMYADHSTGPLLGLELLLSLTKNTVSTATKQKLSVDLVDWFFKNSNLFMTGQVLEDAICNWQKNTRTYIRYTG